MLHCTWNVIQIRQRRMVYYEYHTAVPCIKPTRGWGEDNEDWLPNLHQGHKHSYSEIHQTRSDDVRRHLEEALSIRDWSPMTSFVEPGPWTPSSCSLSSSSGAPETHASGLIISDFQVSHCVYFHEPMASITTNIRINPLHNTCHS
jgi:hypothetical protein